MNKLNKCPDCNVNPGEIHKDNCDVERCSICGGQKLSCECKNHDRQFSRWTGIWPGLSEAMYLNINLNTIYEENYYKIFFIKPKPKPEIKNKLCFTPNHKIVIKDNTFKDYKDLTKEDLKNILYI